MKEQQLIQAIKTEINLLEGWIAETKSGGWSTHLVQPMEKRASELKNLIYDLTK